MPDYQSKLKDAVPGEHENADVPKALTVFATAISESLNTHDHVMDEMVRRVNPEQITSDASVRAHAVCWMNT
ncbi:hypothetical protein [Stomatohabitans albus]|uniref:hypothetical protein n=1 Tax=Stomatohabitans albus TaxID=3110766 RepID=UPI00300D0ABB